jgi:predicted phage terminase large subunit-like protein
LEIEEQDEKVKLIQSYHITQRLIFDDKHRIKIIAKGRRFGLTRGFAIYVVEKLLMDEGPILWVDTIYSNIKRYVEIYVKPELKRLQEHITYNYNKTDSRLEIMGQYCDFRSSDKPENIEGFGYRHIIINEAGIVLKNRNLWQESIAPMAIDYNAKILIGGTPKGKKVKNNEVHLFYEMFMREKLNPDYKSFNFSTYENPLLKEEVIKSVEQEIPAHLRAQEIYGEFINRASSGIIKNEWWKFIDEADVFKERILKKVQIWDTAFKEKQENDFSVCLTWIVTPNKYILIDVFRDRIEFPELKRKAIDQYERFRVNEVWIEDKASGISLIQELKRGTRIAVKEIKADKDKLEYITAITPLIEQGRVYLISGQAWLKDFMDECEEYPAVEFDDQIDAMAKFLNEVKNKELGATPGIMVSRRKLGNKNKRVS